MSGKAGRNDEAGHGFRGVYYRQRVGREIDQAAPGARYPRVARERSIWAAGVEKLAEIPLDPQVAQAGDDGRPLLVSHPSSPQTKAIRDLAARLNRVGT